MEKQYRLEVTVRCLHDVSLPLQSGSVHPITIRFMDFPPIVVPSDPIEPQQQQQRRVQFNVCHKADFRLDSTQAAALLPAKCFCQFGLDAAIRWSCPCPVQSNGPANNNRPYVSYPMVSTTTGATLGYAEMSCIVVEIIDQAESQSQPQPQQQQVVSQISPPPALSQAQATATKPYIVRVVVKGSGRHGASRERQRMLSSSVDSGDGEGRQRSRGKTQSPGRQNPSSQHEQRRTSRDTIEKHTLLYILEYNIAFQLQSLSESLATTLKREHDKLNVIAVAEAAKSLTRPIGKRVEQISKLANIVLQIANQLIDENGTTPQRTGTTRELSEGAPALKRNPVNKLPTPEKGSVSHFLVYEVLFQLQCIGTNLSYLTIAYHDALEVPLKKLSAQYVEFCKELGDAVQSLIKYVNIMIQSAVDKRFSKDGTAIRSSPERKKDEKKRKSKAEKKRSAAFSGTSSSSSRSSSSRSYSSASSWSSLTSRSSSSFSAVRKSPAKQTPATQSPALVPASALTPVLPPATLAPSLPPPPPPAPTSAQPVPVPAPASPVPVPVTSSQTPLPTVTSVLPVPTPAAAPLTPALGASNDWSLTPTHPNANAPAAPSQWQNTLASFQFATTPPFTPPPPLPVPTAGAVELQVPPSAPPLLSPPALAVINPTLLGPVVPTSATTTSAAQPAAADYYT